MLAWFRSRLTFANVVSLMALFVALSGGAYALTIPKNSVGAKQLKENAVTRSKIKRSAVTSSKVKDQSLLARDFKAGQLPRGEQGVRGEQGIQGEPATRLWAVVNADTASPAIRRQSGAVGLERRSAGVYDVRFNRSVRDCATSAVVAENLGVGDFERTIIAFTGGDSPGPDDDEVLVGVLDSPNTGKDTDFSVQVFC